jgi:hypothetical protein
MPSENEETLPQHLLDLLATLPAKTDRRAGAQLVSAHIFPVSPETLKSWPLPWEYPNGRAIAPSASYVTYAWQKSQTAPAQIGLGCRRKLAAGKPETPVPA